MGDSYPSSSAPLSSSARWPSHIGSGSWPTPKGSPSSRVGTVRSNGSEALGHRECPAGTRRVTQRCVPCSPRSAGAGRGGDPSAPKTRYRVGGSQEDRARTAFERTSRLQEDRFEPSKGLGFDAGAATRERGSEVNISAGPGAGAASEGGFKTHTGRDCEAPEAARHGHGEQQPGRVDQ